MSIARLISQLAFLIGSGTRMAIVTESTLNDASSNESIKTVATASAVNEFTVTNAATGNSPTLAASGDNTNVGFILAPKGTAGIIADGNFAIKRTVTTNTTASNQTYTAAQIAGGIMLRDPNGSARTDTTDTAANILSQFLGAKVGSSFIFFVRNNAAAAQTITVAGGTGVTLSGTGTIVQNNTKLFIGVFTNVDTGTEALTLYSVGNFVHS